MDLLKKSGDSYANSEIAETCLVNGKPFYQGDMIAHSDYIRRYWENLENQIYIDPPAKVAFGGFQVRIEITSRLAKCFDA